MNFGNWFRQMWPFHDKARAVLGEYASIGSTHRLFLADLSLRAGVYAEGGRDATPDQRAYDAGRRDVALETLKLCNADPALLFALIEKKPSGER